MVRRVHAYSIGLALVAAGCAPPKDESGVPVLDQLQTAAAAGNLKRAAALAHRALGANPDAQKYLDVSEAYAGGDQFTEAANLLERALRAFPLLETDKKMDLYDHLAADYYKGGDVQNGQKACETALALKPDSVVMQNDYAYFIADYGGDMKLALKMARFAYDKAPDQMTTLDTYGWVLVRSGDAKRAIPLLERASAAVGAYGDVMFHLAQAYDADGRKDSAVQAYVKAAKFRSSNKTVRRRALARLRRLDPKAYAEATKLDTQSSEEQAPGPRPSPLGGWGGNPSPQSRGK